MPRGPFWSVPVTVNSSLCASRWGFPWPVGLRHHRQGATPVQAQLSGAKPPAAQSPMTGLSHPRNNVARILQPLPLQPAHRCGSRAHRRVHCSCYCSWTSGTTASRARELLRTKPFLNTDRGQASLSCSSAGTASPRPCGTQGVRLQLEKCPRHPRLRATQTNFKHTTIMPPSRACQTINHPAPHISYPCGAKKSIQNRALMTIKW